MLPESIPYFWLWTLLTGTVLLIIPIFLFTQRKKNLQFKLLVYLAAVIFLFRLFVELNEIPVGASGLLWYEKIFDSIIHTFQSFSFDDDYSYFLLQGREIFNSWGMPGAGAAYSLLSSLLNLSAPLAAGAVLIDLLTNLFPRLRILVSPYRKKAVFSQLNPSSLLLLEDMIKTEKEYQREVLSGSSFWNRIRHRNVLYILCSAYSSEEADEESLRKAKALGAVCIRSDLLSLNLHRSKEVDYFLIHEEAEKNLTDLSKLLSPQDDTDYPWPKSIVESCPSSAQSPASALARPRFRPTQIYLFVEDQNQTEMTDLICQQHPKAWSKVLVLTIAKNRIIAMNLIQEIPLFLPLLSEAKKKSLDVVLFGGKQCIELLKAIYWAGQIPDTALSIQIVTQNPDILKNQLQMECPELIRSCQKENPILKVYNDPEDHTFAEPYATIQFHNADTLPFSDELFKTEEERKLKKEQKPNPYGSIFQKTDVFIAAYDDDLLNIQLSAWLSRLCALNRLTTPDQNPMILPQIRDKELADGIRKTKSDDGLPIILPFGLREECFSSAAVLNTNFAKDVEKSAQLYNENHDQKIETSAYEYWSNLAKSIHADYKMFGMNLINSYSFNEKNRVQFHYLKSHELKQEDSLKLAYIEHRRWNAYMRTAGYRQPDLQEFSSYTLEGLRNGIQKIGRNTLLKLHPCLVEADGQKTSLSTSSLQLEGKMDYLDFTSALSYLYACEADPNKYKKPDLTGLLKFEYKQWDFLSFDSALQNRLKKIQITDDTEDKIYEQARKKESN